MKENDCYGIIYLKTKSDALLTYCYSNITKHNDFMDEGIPII